jgi:hypothetical protein
MSTSLREFLHLRHSKPLLIYKMKKIIVLLSLTVLGACSSNTEDDIPIDKIITTNDFESVIGWNANTGTIDKGRAHSGKYAIKVDQDHEFSLTYDVALGEVTPRKPRILHLKAWAFLGGYQSTGVLGIQIMEPGVDDKQVFSDGIKLIEAVKSYKKWVQISKDIVLPDNVTAAQHIRLSLWRADASDLILIDDVSLSVKE